METLDLRDHINNIIDAHSVWNSSFPEKAFRKFDGLTPYFVHPIWCATTIATENFLPKELRDLGFLVLLYHDVLEDTIYTEKSLLRLNLSTEVICHIKNMTFIDNADEMINVWAKEPRIRLFKLYDKVNNLINVDGWPKEKIKLYIEYAEKLAKDVENNYGKLNIHYIFEGIKKKYEV